MVHSLIYAGLLAGSVILSLLVAPVLVLAQEASSTTATATTATTTVNDGSSEAPVERQQNVRGWRRQSSEVQQKINALSNTAVQAIEMPVLFGVAPSDISPNFGAPRGNGTRTHEGEDIMATKGTPIVSPTEAVVLRTVTGPDEGNTVYTANPGGETFVYMHLDRFGEGVSSGAILHTGSLIGYVGNTGNASGGAAHLHFEVHNNSGAPTDPFPRLTAEFTPEQKISFLNAILAITTSPTTLAQFLVSNFRSLFGVYGSAGITLPPLIVEAYAAGPSTSPTPSTPILPAGDLDVGSDGPEVEKLQTFLIVKAVGPAAARLARSGATGYFGPITQAALAEYQASVSITPANGYYGPATRVLVEANSTSTPTTPAPTPPQPQTPTTFTRDLEVGSTGDDVQALQIFLNSHGFALATEGVGSAGQETTRFGALTRAALARYQASKNISPAIGYFGPITRGVIVAALVGL